MEIRFSLPGVPDGSALAEGELRSHLSRDRLGEVVRLPRVMGEQGAARAGRGPEGVDHVDHEEDWPVAAASLHSSWIVFHDNSD